MPVIRSLPSTDRPRERLVSSGAAALTDAELVALVFGGGLDCAAALVGRFGGVQGLRRALPGELRDVAGVGLARACQLLAALELGVRAATAEVDRRAPIRTPHQALAHLRELAQLDQEELHVLGLDARHRVLGRFGAARGALNVVHVSPRDVFRRLLREGAAACIIGHNHPSGDATPSEDDADLTRRMRAAGELVGVPLLDHLVVGAGSFYSFNDGRLLHAQAPP